MKASALSTAVSSSLQTLESPTSVTPPVAESTSSGGDTACVATSRAPCKITAQQWDTVAVWSWNAQTRVCAICKNSLADHCINCLAKVSSLCTSSGTTSTLAAPGAPLAVKAERSSATKSEASTLPPPLTTTAKNPHLATLGDLSDKCCVAWGTCGHVYHYHCISRWLQMRSICPVCGRQWHLHKITSNE
ncbi:hypothetical protein JKF63_05271 [Porcisia hertigi]|uniref:RING-type domain-containing protein n=1 Tax=Porcisia hertigi TaxID=2761500 RepID=A0A836ITC7_9TRYP|nr:hypothetical protein JKF63_05271 [Porcisia hertigi]